MIPSSLDTWLTETCRLTHYQLCPLLGDASFRRYFRVKHSAGSYIAMDASIEKESCTPFVAIATELNQQGLQTPKIIASDLSKGFLLLTDFGDRLYLKELTVSNADLLYTRALDALSILKNCHEIPQWELKFFNQERMRDELMLCKEWFFEKYLSLTLSREAHARLNASFDFLAENAANQPLVFMHRDYHSANLMRLENEEVGILDFQDAFIGPLTYDVVSLLRDCYIDWPEKRVIEWATYYWQKIALPSVSLETFLRWFDLMGIQRHLKCLLTFSRKYCRDQNAEYVQHIPRTLHYIITISERYPECKALTIFLREEVMEKCAQ